MNLGVVSTLFFCSIFFVVIFLNRLKLNKRSIYALNLWGGYAVAVIFFFYTSNQSLDGRTTVASLIYSLLSVLMISFLPPESRKNMTKALYYSILILVLLIIFQHIYYFVFSIYFDVHNIVTLGKYVSRYESNYLAQFGILRPTGLSVEPSNYSAVLLYMIFSYAWLKGRLDNSVIILLFLSSLTLSFASMGIVAAVLSVIVLARLIKSKRIFDLAIVLIVFLVTAVVLQILIDRITSAVDYDALGARMQIVKYYRDIDINSALAGHGILFFNDFVTFNSIDLSNSQIRDSGVWVSIFFAAGILGLALLLLLLFSVNWPLFSIAIAIALFSKLDFMQPSFWILISILSSYTSVRRSND